MVVQDIDNRVEWRYMLWVQALYFQIISWEVSCKELCYVVASKNKTEGDQLVHLSLICNKWTCTTLSFAQAGELDMQKMKCVCIQLYNWKWK